jgi:hypothetical protein
MPVTVSELSFPVKLHMPCPMQYSEYLHWHDERQMATLSEMIVSQMVNWVQLQWLGYLYWNQLIQV